MTELLVLAIFPSLVIMAAVSDVLTLTIPNWISIALAAGFGILAAMVGLPLEAVGSHLLAGLAVLAVGFGLFAARLIGGGDAKLLAAASLWIGWAQLPSFVLVTGIAGGALAIAIVMVRRVPLPVVLASHGWVQRLIGAKDGIPYGAAIATAAIMVYPHTLWMTQTW